MSGGYGDTLKAIVEAGKGNIDFIAFALVAVLAVGALAAGAGFGASAGIAVVLSVIWVVLRYALLSIQYREKLRDLQLHATIEAQKKLQEHATPEMLRDLFTDREAGGDRP
ncbi:MAG TPA: hypothetical protein VMF90_12230 [Rhizobiaceae bacterium]|nr:hypothetical protein [Rhizobiaceae bacterium]